MKNAPKLGLKEALLREDDVIRILQAYKPALTKIFQNPVILELNSEGNITVRTSYGVMSLEPIVNTSLRVVGISELVKPVAVVKLVEEWWGWLTPRQREAIFYRYIDHDELTSNLDLEDFRVLYKARSLSQIAKLMEVSKQRVAELIDSALGTILKRLEEVR